MSHYQPSFSVNAPYNSHVRKIYFKAYINDNNDLDLILTLSLRGGLSNGTLKTTIEVATLELCNFSTIHCHGSILGSFESQEPQLSFSRPQICVVRPSQPGSVLRPHNPRVTISSSPPRMS